MSRLLKFPTPPPLVISESDHRALNALLDSARATDLHEDLQDEIDRARVAPDAKLPTGVVRMGSSVRYRTDDGHIRDVILVWPKDADIEAGRVSILTPVGTALIGLRTGQSIAWTTRTGRRHTLTVLDVRQDAPADGPENGPGPQAA